MFPNCPIQQLNKSATVLGMDNEIPAKDQTNDHNSVASEQC